MKFIDFILTIGGLLPIENVDDPKVIERKYKRWQSDGMSQKQMEKWAGDRGECIDDYYHADDERGIPWDIL